MNPQNIKSFSFLIPSYLLTVTEFLGKISQFEFLVMTEKNIFAYKLFLSLNISNFNLFLMWKLHTSPHEKSHPLSQQPPLKVEVLSSPPPLFLENLIGDSSPCRKGDGGSHWKIVKFSFVAFLADFFFILPSNLWHFEDVPIKCPKQLLYYIDFICRRKYAKKFKSEFHVFGWFSGFQNLDAFLNNILWSYFENRQK